MTRVGFKLSVAVLPAFLMCAVIARADATNEAPDFKEVYDLVRSHLVGVTDAELNRSAVDGLLTQLRGKVSIVGQKDDAIASNAPFTSHVSVLDDGIACVRVGRIAQGLAEDLNAAWRQLSATNQLNGLVLDLRYASGHDYAAAAAAADLFTAKARVLLDWDSGVARSKAKSNAITLPVAVLVNRQTSGAAEALAAVMRETGAGLILGGTTAGTAMITREFPLKDGRRLLIATKPVKLGNGDALSAQGVKPDIEVAVRPEAEREYFEDAYAIIAGASPVSSNVDSNRLAEIGRTSRRQRISEADLVRERREGITNVDSNLTSGTERGPEKPIIRDPVLARAVDLLKGLAVVRKPRS